MSEIKLLPCPFCSNKDVRLQHRGRTKYGYYVICKNCGCRTPLYQYQFDSKEKRMEEAIKTWNTRKPMQEIVERLEWEKTKPMRMNLYGAILVKVDKAIEIVKEVGVIDEE